MTREPQVTELMWLEEKTKIPYWCFAVALDIRPVLKYSGTDLEWLKYNLLYISNLRPHGHWSEEYFAMRMRYEEILLDLANSAKTDEEIDYVLRNTGPFVCKASEIIAEKTMKRRRPAQYKFHRKSLKGENAKRLAELQQAKTEEDLWPLVNGVIAELPQYDTVTEAALTKLIKVTRSMETIEWIVSSTTVTHLPVRFDLCRRVYELWKTQTLVEE